MENQVEEKTDNKMGTWVIGDKIQRTKSSYHSMDLQQMLWAPCGDSSA